MSALRAILDRLNDIEATISRAEMTAGSAPSLAVRLSLQSLEKRRDMLREELAEVTEQTHVEICDYRIIPESSVSYAVSAVSAALHYFQDMVTLVFDAKQRSTPKQRGKVSRVATQKTQFDFGFAYSGSLGIVLTIPNDRLLMDEASDLDQAVSAVFDLLKVANPEAVRQAAHTYGIPTVRKLHDWTKVQSQHGMSADIKWVRGKEVRNEVLAQPVEMERVYRIIEKRSEKRRESVKVVGELLAWSIPKKSFTIQIGDQEPISGHWGPNFLAPARVRRVPSRYRASLTKETIIHYARDKDDVSWFLDRLTPVRTRKPK